MENLYSNKKFHWMEEILSNLNASNALSIANNIIASAKITGTTTATLIAHFISTIYATTTTKTTQIEDLKKVISNRDDLIDSLKKQLAELETPSSNPLETLPMRNILEVPRPTRPKSPKKNIQEMVDFDRTKLEFRPVRCPSAKIFPQVVDFHEILLEGQVTNTYLCVHCERVLMSSEDRNNQRSFSNHLKTCVENKQI